jgi:hypothetical protein
VNHDEANMWTINTFEGDICHRQIYYIKFQVTDIDKELAPHLQKRIKANIDPRPFPQERWYF